jgi:hypothetical protein
VKAHPSKHSNVPRKSRARRRIIAGVSDDRAGRSCRTIGRVGPRPHRCREKPDMLKCSTLIR